MNRIYRDLTQQIHTPSGLNRRVLAAARAQSAQSPQASRGIWQQPAWRIGLCSVCALALILGTVALRPQTATPGVVAPVYSFGITAYAAETGIVTAPSDGTVVFASGSGVDSLESGFFSGCLFRVSGDNISKVAASIDRGGFYRYQMKNDLTNEEMQAIREAQAKGIVAPTSIDQDGNGAWSTAEMTPLGTAFEADHDAEISYGFWAATDTAAQGHGDLAEAFHRKIDAFDGATLTLTVTFDDNSTQTQSLPLHAGKLRLSDTGEPLAALATENEPYVYGIYGQLTD